MQIILILLVVLLVKILHSLNVDTGFIQLSSCILYNYIQNRNSKWEDKRILELVHDLLRKKA
jgi:hypothetical protein